MLHVLQEKHSWLKYSYFWKYGRFFSPEHEKMLNLPWLTIWYIVVRKEAIFLCFLISGIYCLGEKDYLTDTASFFSKHVLEETHENKYCSSYFSPLNLQLQTILRITMWFESAPLLRDFQCFWTSMFLYRNSIGEMISLIYIWMDMCGLAAARVFLTML
jgi:hypothetical protein